MTITVNNVLFAAPADLLATAKAIPADTLAVFRETFASAFRVKLDSMKDASAGNASLLLKLEKEAGRGAHDAALRVMLASGIPADFFLRTVRGGGQAFNIYGIPKALLLSRMMLSSAPLWGNSSDARTLRGTIAALLAGAHNTPKGVSTFLNDYMSALGAGGGNYRSGSTQSSSSAHALAAMGLLNVPAQGEYSVPQGHALAVLQALMGQEQATVPLTADEAVMRYNALARAGRDAEALKLEREYPDYLSDDAHDAEDADDATQAALNA